MKLRFAVLVMLAVMLLYGCMAAAKIDSRSVTDITSFQHEGRWYTLLEDRR